MKMRTVNVDLGQRSYAIKIRRGLIDGAGTELRALGFNGRVAVITNPVVSALYGQRLDRSLKASGFSATVIEMPDGEEHKNLKEAGKIYDALVSGRFERGSPIVALGGGVAGDIAGFVAATYLRGVPYVQVPTTLLSQVDSSVGGKTGVNHEMGKNLIGAFYQPRAVLIDPDALKTLDKRELKAGLAEVVKYGVIWDRDFFAFIEGHAEGILGLEDEVIDAIERSCRIKADVVARDETEQDIRSVLNFGHTFGHAIEAIAGYGHYRHGEAIAIGMVLASGLSARLGLCGPEVGERVKALLVRLGLPIEAKGIDARNFIRAMRLDKKVEKERIRFVLAEDIGKVVLREVPEHELAGFLENAG